MAGAIFQVLKLIFFVALGASVPGVIIVGLFLGMRRARRSSGATPQQAKESAGESAIQAIQPQSEGPPATLLSCLGVGGGGIVGFVVVALLAANGIVGNEAWLFIAPVGGALVGGTVVLIIVVAARLWAKKR